MSPIDHTTVVAPRLGPDSATDLAASNSTRYAAAFYCAVRDSHERGGNALRAKPPRPCPISPPRDPDRPIRVGYAVRNPYGIGPAQFVLFGRAYETGTLSADIAAEQDKLRWADTVILQFPLWWYSMPAILEGWVDRVFTYKFAYGVGEHSDTRYGEGTLAGKRAVLSVTIGGREPYYSDRGINGPIDDLLFPIQHGILYYPGMDVLPPFVTYAAHRLSPEDFTDTAKAWEQRLLSIEKTAPIAYRPQNGGDYERPALRLREGLEAKGRTGFGLHIRA